MATFQPQILRGNFVISLTGYNSWVKSVAINLDGKILVSNSGDKTVKIGSFPTGELKYTLKNHLSWIRSVAINPKGNIVTSASNDTTIKLWDGSNSQLLTTLASSRADGTIVLWNLGTVKPLRTLIGHSPAGNSLAFSLDKTILASSTWDSTIKIWQVKMSRLINSTSLNL